MCQTKTGQLSFNQLGKVQIKCTPLLHMARFQGIFPVNYATFDHSKPWQSTEVA